MGFGLVVTTGEDRVVLPDRLAQWLVEARVEMELSAPTRFALRFEDDICGDEPAVEGADELSQGRHLGLFVLRDEELECLVYGPVTRVRSSSTLAGAGSWVEIHGEDRRVEMDRVGVQAVYTGRASAVAASILRAHGFEPDTQQTLIVHDEQDNQLSQRATDLVFLQDIARRNNMELWLSYGAQRAAGTDTIALTETANLRTSPTRTQAGDAPSLPTLVPEPERVLKVNPPPDDCATVSRFEARIDYEKPAAAKGFALSSAGDKRLVSQLVASAEPVDPGKPVPLGDTEREAIPPPEPTPEEGRLAQDALVFEQSWFVEVDCSTTLDLAGFLLRPHQIVDVAHAGARLSGAYQVMAVTHVVTPTDHYMDCTIRANGLGGAN